MCDRFTVYPAVAGQLGLTVVVCRYHARRDFTDAECGHPELARWCNAWVKRFAEIYRLDDRWLVHYEQDLELSQQSASFHKADAKLRKAVEAFFSWHLKSCIRAFGAGHLLFTIWILLFSVHLPSEHIAIPGFSSEQTYSIFCPVETMTNCS